MEQATSAAGLRSNNEDLARVADELLEHTRALRTQYEELRDALEGVAPAPLHEPNGDRPAHATARERGIPDSLHAMALQMALGGETRESVKEQLQTLHVDGADDIVDEVFDRIEASRSEDGRRRLFSRRAN